MSRFRKLLVVLLLVGLAGLDQSGTQASFSAVTTNADSTFATGSIVLSNQRNNAAACFSAGASTDDNHNEACAAVFTLALQDGGASNARITVVNEGNLDASRLTLHWADGPVACATVDATDTPFHGDGDLCDLLRLQVQEYPDATAQTDNDRTNGSCWFGANAGTNNCGYSNTEDLAAFSLLDGTPPAPDVLDLGPMAAGQTRWFRLYLQLPAAQVANPIMGRAVQRLHLDARAVGRSAGQVWQVGQA